MWVIEIETGKKKYVRCAEVVEDWLRDKPKYKMIKKQGLTNNSTPAIIKT